MENLQITTFDKDKDGYPDNTQYKYFTIQKTHSGLINRSKRLFKKKTQNPMLYAEGLKEYKTLY